MSSNHKQNGLECNPMRTTSTPHTVAHPSVSCTIAMSPECCITGNTFSKSPLNPKLNSL